ncbi:MAG: cryptochrome/photolyase family protein [Bdellovibrio sp.]|jgi:deoxyribodipyrimidine photolyase-related protein
MKTESFVVILGNQLFDPQILNDRLGPDSPVHVFMREDAELCTFYRFHKQKITFFLAAMRTYAEELEQQQQFKVHYQALQTEGAPQSYEQALTIWLKSHQVPKVYMFEIEDKFFERRLLSLFQSLEVECEIFESPMFLTSRTQFTQYLKKNKRPFMKTFYQEQRARLGILIEKNGQPTGGRWSFDDENRKALPTSIQPPPVPRAKTTPALMAVAALCEKMFSSHPGAAGPFWLPVDREGARSWLEDFIDARLASFGPYEDAIPAHSDFLFHSVLTPFLNTGLLTPGEVVERVLFKAKSKKIHIASVEGFIRQVIGWREFVRGIYQNFGAQQAQTNFWNHKMRLSDVWYQGGTGIPPLDRALERVHQHGYLHHIERLMVVGSLMLLLEVDPKEGHRWFMEMFIDSSNWVMGPNVYGMALFSDGGIFATKPYICGSNYYRKMGGDKKGDWCEGVDGLYWSFIQKHQNFFLKNPRLSMMARSVQKMDPHRLASITAAADELRSRLVRNPAN